MPNLHIDFSEIPSLEPVPAGTYLASIIQADAGESQAGNPKVDLRWKIVGGEFDGRLIFDHLSFAPTALWRTKLFLQAVGFGEGFAGDVDTDDLVGKMASLTVAIESGRTNPDTGETYPDRNRVIKVKPAEATAEDLLS
jgi:hypothetical protein